MSYCKWCDAEIDNACIHSDAPPHVAKVIELDDYRKMEDIVKQRLEADHVIICSIGKHGFTSYIPPELNDIELVYMIQTLTDRRARRVNDINS